jgi:hypothetical protein
MGEFYSRVIVDMCKDIIPRLKEKIKEEEDAGLLEEAQESRLLLDEVERIGRDHAKKASQYRS